MKKQSFQRMLKSFHDELDKINVVDKDLRQHLKQVQEHIEAILTEPDRVTEQHRINFINKLKKIVDDFEISHPELTSTLGEMADSLSRMGF